MEKGEKNIKEELIEKYKIDLDKLKKEQKKLSRNLEIKDSLNFENVTRVGGIHNVFLKNQIISGIIVLEDSEVIGQAYFKDKVRFPYLPEFRAYRELSAMVHAFNKLEEKPEVIFIRGHGILHPRKLGLASHFSLTINTPVIGIADSLLTGEIKNSKIYLNGKINGKVVKTKEGANPLLVSPGNLISVETSEKLVKKFTFPPHKFPEALDKARKYSKSIRKEIN